MDHLGVDQPIGHEELETRFAAFDHLIEIGLKAPADLVHLRDSLRVRGAVERFCDGVDGLLGSNGIYE